MGWLFTVAGIAFIGVALASGPGSVGERVNVGLLFLGAAAMVPVMLFAVVGALTAGLWWGSRGMTWEQLGRMLSSEENRR